MNATAKEITRALLHPLDGVGKVRKARKTSDGRCEHLCDYLRSKIGDLDGTETDNRRAVWTLILRAEKMDPEGDAVTAIERLVDIATDPALSWHAKNVTSYRYLLNHARQIANEHRQRKPASAVDRLASALAANAVHYGGADAGTGHGAG